MFHMKTLNKTRKIVRNDFGRLVHANCASSKKDALIADLQSNSPYTPVSEESKQMHRHQFAPIIRPDIQNPTARKGNSSSNIKNFPQVTPQQVQSISIQQARRNQLRALSIMVQAG